jgi:hypothetical protein
MHVGGRGAVGAYKASTVTSVFHTNLWWTGSVFRCLCPALVDLNSTYFVSKTDLVAQPDFHAPSHLQDKAWSGDQWEATAVSPAA